MLTEHQRVRLHVNLHAAANACRYVFYGNTPIGCSPFTFASHVLTFDTIIIDVFHFMPLGPLVVFPVSRMHHSSIYTMNEVILQFPGPSRRFLFIDVLVL